MVEVTLVRPDDYEALAAFMSSFPDVKPRSVDGWRSRLHAWWELNPAFDESLPRGWLIRDDGKIGGFFGSLPIKIQLGGEEKIAFAATSWRVLPPYRGKSIGLKMRQLDAHKENLHFSTTPKEERVPFLKRLGYQQIPRGAGTDVQSQFIVDFEKFLRGKLGTGQLEGVGAKLGAPILSVAQAVRLRRLGKSGGGEVRNVAKADATFDDLWRRTRGRFANTNIRTAEMLNWYCFAIQPIEKTLLGHYDGGTLTGYMVLWTKTDPHRQFIECVDVWIDPAAGEARVLEGLVASAVDHTRQSASDRILFPHFDTATGARYADLGLLQGPSWKKREYVKGPKDVMATITVDNSYFVRAQGDYGL